ncbi:hypothetical protein [Bacillus pumilus]|uniref:hypothetical protein n=1 Tax=Bacillus pumilus TaxID=1408 RepID=UPI0020A081DD|nr:hypothetical protein [Bacillus pumilus]MCP1528604.1 hypothetical protein [Bacillus pumilus]MDF9783985.1 hypothetical protein [Bacillus pumilus]
MKKVVLGFIALLLMSSLFGYNVNAADTVKKDEAVQVKTIQDYKDYLAGIIKKEGKDSDAVEVQKKFNSLSKDKQQKFVDIMNDEKALKEIIETDEPSLSTYTKSETTALNGDYKIISEEVKNEKPQISTMAATERRAAWAHTHTLFAVPLVKTTIELYYNADGKTLIGSPTKVSSFINYIYFPPVKLSKNGTRKGGMEVFYGMQRWAWHLVSAKWGTQYGTREQYIFVEGGTLKSWGENKYIN